MHREIVHIGYKGLTPSQRSLFPWESYRHFRRNDLIKMCQPRRANTPAQIISKSALTFPERAPRHAIVFFRV